MKVLRAISISKIPKRLGGGRSKIVSIFYDEITKKLDKLSSKSALPIECESKEECVSVQHALRWRGCSYTTRKHIVYAKGNAK